MAFEGLVHELNSAFHMIEHKCMNLSGLRKCNTGAKEELQILFYEFRGKLVEIFTGIIDMCAKPPREDFIPSLLTHLEETSKNYKQIITLLQMKSVLNSKIQLYTCFLISS
jgi:hypothetical protein